MSNIEQGMSKEEVGGRLYAKLLLWTFLVGHSSFNLLWPRMLIGGFRGLASR